jgi:hypothetical protein
MQAERELSCFIEICVHNACLRESNATKWNKMAIDAQDGFGLKEVQRPVNRVITSIMV